MIFDLIPDISILIIDDSSRDGTPKLVKSFQKKYPNLSLIIRGSNFGYGRACLEGFRWVMDHDFETIISMDADFSHDYREIPNLLNNLSASDVVIGSRYIRGGKIKNWKFHRKILSRIANLYVRAILKMKIQDITTGFNAYRVEILKKIDLSKISSDGYAFLVELKYRLSKNGANIKEFPITFHERREGQSKMSSKVIWESLFLPWKLLIK
jgi:dolichol-phosphate mannosyltransferase